MLASPDVLFRPTRQSSQGFFCIVAIDQKSVAQIAALARLRVAADEIDGLATELTSILAWVEQLAEVDTGSVVPLTSIADIYPPHRGDIVNDGNVRQDVLSNAPQALDEFYAVPKVVE